MHPDNGLCMFLSLSAVLGLQQPYLCLGLLLVNASSTQVTMNPCTQLHCITLLQTGLEKMLSLKVFLCSNNKIASWAEVERLGSLSALEELLLVGNPLYNDFKDKGETQQYRIEVISAAHDHAGQVASGIAQPNFASSCCADAETSSSVEEA